MQDENNSKKSSEEIQFYLHCISSQDSLLQNYRMLFIAIETVFFGLAYVLYQTGSREFIKIPAIIGIILCGVWIFVCTHRGCMIDRLKEELKQLCKGSNGNLEGWFALSYGKASSEECLKNPINLLRAFIGPSEKWVPRVVFNFLSPLILLILWILIAF
ncbi:MAG: hypothetical protein KAT65_30225 [Methanophagales archaeon]|nr:hypothetical protein [Methanophagales archaeon]